jgi:hypothetical protein
MSRVVSEIGTFMFSNSCVSNVTVDEAPIFETVTGRLAEK